MNKKGFTLIELLAGMVIVMVFSIYFYRIIILLKNKYEYVVEKSNIELEKSYIIRMIHNTLDNYEGTCTFEKSGNDLSFKVDTIEKLKLEINNENLIMIDTVTKTLNSPDTKTTGISLSQNLNTYKVELAIEVNGKPEIIKIYKTCN